MRVDHLTERLNGAGQKGKVFGVVSGEGDVGDETFESPLTWEKEVMLAHRMEEGASEARELLFELHLGFVARIARRYRGRGAPMDDLVQEASLGLIRAIDRFDYRVGLRLATFATPWIEGSILQRLQNHQRLVGRLGDNRPCKNVEGTNNKEPCSSPPLYNHWKGGDLHDEEEHIVREKDFKREASHVCV